MSKNEVLRLFNPKSGRQVKDTKINRKKIDKSRRETNDGIKLANLQIQVKEQEREIRRLMNKIKSKNTVRKALKKYVKDKKTKYSYDVYSKVALNQDEIDIINQKTGRKKNIINDTYFENAFIGRITFTRRMKENYEGDHSLLKRIVRTQLNEFQRKIRNISDSGDAPDGYRLKNEQVENDIKVDIGALNRSIVYDNRNKTIQHPLIVNKINKEATEPSKFIQDIIRTTGKMSCGVDIIMTLQENWDKTYSKKLTVEVVKKQLKQIANENNLEIDETDGKFGTSNELIGLWFLQIAKICFTCVDTFGVLIYPIEEASVKAFQEMKVNKHLGYRGIYVLQANNHYYKINECVQSIAHQISTREYTAIGKPSEFFMTFDKEKEKDKKQYTIDEIKDVSQIFLKLKQVEGNTKFYYPHSIADVIMYLKNEIGIMPIGLGSVINVDGCYIEIGADEDRFRITFQSLASYKKDKDDMLLDLTKEQLTTYEEINSKLYKKLFKSEYMSDMSDDLKEAFSKIPSPLQTFFDYEACVNAGNFCGIDANKSYAYALHLLGGIPRYSIFDDYQTYNGEEIEHHNLYTCEWVASKRTICDNLLSMIKEEEQTQFTVFGFVLEAMKEYSELRYISEYKIIKFIKPYEVLENPIQEDIKNIFNENVKLPMSLKKNIPNFLVGMCAKRKNTNKKIYLSTDKKELTYQRKQLEGKVMNLTNISHINDELMFFCQSNSTDYNNGLYAVNAMIYCISRLRNILLYTRMMNLGITPLGVKVDLLYFDYAKLNEKQKNWVSKLDKNTWGGFKAEYNKKKPENLFSSN